MKSWIIKIEVSSKIREICPEFAGAAIFATVKNTSYNKDLWTKINQVVQNYKGTHKLEDIKENSAIKATRLAYKRLGKDPNRYRPSAEALCRRILRELPLYQIDTLVDLINLISIKTGYSIGGFDADKIVGDTLTLGIGEADEPYEAIGRGLLNIESLPVYRDSLGGIGTPTSDNERTKIELSTTRILTIINNYNGGTGLAESVDYMKSLLLKYADVSSIESYAF